METAQLNATNQGQDTQEQPKIEKNEKDVETTSQSSQDGIMSKKAQAREKQKYKKKMAQTQGVICRAESKQYSECINQNDNPSRYMFVSHFGCGDEIDQNVLLEFCQSKGGPLVDLTIFPGTTYGHLEFVDIESAKRLIDEAMDEKNCVNLRFEGTFNPERTVVFYYTPLLLSELKRSEKVEIPTAQVAETNIIPGLYIYDNFITEEEEKVMMEEIDKNKWTKLLSRKVQHYGFEFKYGTNDVDPDKSMGELPNFCSGIVPKIEELLNTFCVDKTICQQHNEKKEVQIEAVHKEDIEKDNQQYQSYYKQYGQFDQLTINNYSPGDGIAPHVDSHSPFQEIFVALSLNSGVTMHFKKGSLEQGETEIIKDVYLQPRSLMLFSGEARYNWVHSIPQRKIDKVSYKNLPQEELGKNLVAKLKHRSRRVSLTFRKVKLDGPCRCKWPKLCDSQNKTVAVAENQLGGEEGEAPVYKGNQNQPDRATNMEKEHVYDVYEKIASHFSNTRYKPWPNVKEFIESFPPGSLVADVGCGNGKYLGINDESLFTIGTDRSFNLIDIARQKKVSYQTFVADSLILPVRSNCFDRVISIAVVHHFSTDSLRVKAIDEFHRILVKGGQVMISVWAYEQEHKKFQQQDVFVKWNLHDSYQKGKKNGKKEENGKDNQEQNQEEAKQADVQSNLPNPDSSKQSKESTSFIQTALTDEEKKTTVYHRYYHMFLQGELDALINKHFENKFKIIDSYFQHANWIVVCEKL